MIPISAGGFTRISKAKAKKLFSQGSDVFMLPCNVNPANPWIKPVLMRAEDEMDETTEKTFEKIENSFHYYNCTTSELGYRTSFYTCENPT